MPPPNRRYRSDITYLRARPSKIDYSQEGVDTRWTERIALLNEYVKHDDGADGRELCTRSLCVMLDGHGGDCKEPE